MTESSMAVAVVWDRAPETVTVRVRDGNLGALRPGERGTAEGNRARFPESGPGRLRIECRGVRIGPGSPATVVALESAGGSFAFFLRDVSGETPIYLPECGAAVVPAEDPRDCPAVAAEIARKRGWTAWQRIEREPEESYANAAVHTRRVRAPTTLGLGRDIRLFEVESVPSPVGPMEPVVQIRPNLASLRVTVPETGASELGYQIRVGRGMGCANPLARRLEEGSLPILRQRLADGDVIYEMAFFCSLETAPLSDSSVRGTHALAAAVHAGGTFLTPKQKAEAPEILAGETSRAAGETWAWLSALRSNRRVARAAPAEADRERFMEAFRKSPPREEETILVCRIKAVNTADVPRYAWLSAPVPVNGEVRKEAGGLHGYDPETGYGEFSSERVFCVARFDGAPMPNAEIAVLIPPKSSREAVFLIPHRPIDRSRAGRLARQSAAAHHEACRAFWRGALEADARIDVPERRIREMIRACRLHLDLVLYGREPGGLLVPSCGRSYSALANESYAMVLFLESMGRHPTAGRAIDFFLEQQQEDGLVRCFGGHESDSGPVLWMFAEHFRYTRDAAWLRERAPRLVRIADALLAWRARNRKGELRDAGRGLIDGQLADMGEKRRGFALNTLGCRGVLELAEVLGEILPEEAARLDREARLWKEDLARAVRAAVERAPVVPLGDGTWAPGPPPWPESDMAACLDGTRAFYTHGTFLTRDNTWAASLAFHRMFDPRDALAERLLGLAADVFHVRHVRHSQPYISWHPWVHLRRGEIKLFLKAYYNTLTSLADRETYTFWEHNHGACPHKTEADGAFLMLTRWMLWMEQGDTLAFLSGVPRSWLAGGRSIRLDRAASHFGPLGLDVEAGGEEIRASFRFAEARRPAAVRLRLPHPSGARPLRVEGGEYEPDSETVVIRHPGPEGHVVLEF